MLNHKEVVGPAIGVDISSYVPLESKPLNKMNSVGSDNSIKTTLDELLSTLGMPPIEQMIDETVNNPNNYCTVVRAITFKGKNRTFKNKVSRKRVLHKSRELDEFIKIMINTI